MELVAGQNITLNTRALVLTFEVGQVPNGLVLDACAFALAANSKVRNDNDFVFFNQPALAGQGIVRENDGQIFKLNLDKLPTDIQKVAITMTLEDGVTKGQSLAAVGYVATQLRDANGAALGNFRVDTHQRREVALMMVEFYRRNTDWKLRALGQGFAGGLQSLAEHYGVSIDEEDNEPASPQPPPASVASPLPRQLPPASPTPVITHAPVNLNKMTIEQRGSSVSLKKRGESFGEIHINLNWQALSQSPPPSGFFSKLMGSDKAIDLDLGCLFEHDNGHRHIIQALGDCFGDYNVSPWICLDGDDRSGTSSSGETLRINGSHWQDFKRILVYAFIYQGAINWTETNACINIKVPQQPEIEVMLDNHQNGQGMCAVALLENTSGSIKVTKLMDYFRDHRTMDQAYGFDLQWSATSK